MTEPCRYCGSTRSNQVDGACLIASGCRHRRMQARKREDAKRGVKTQCFATTGQQSIRFCELREGHDGLHMNGATEWAGNYSHPVADAIRGIAK